jgi:acetoacetyl-CoA synthetase
MWNIFLGGLLTGATLVLYDGSPFYPNPTSHIEKVLLLGWVLTVCLLDLKAHFHSRTTVFGASPRYYTELRERGIKPSRRIPTMMIFGTC